MVFHMQNCLIFTSFEVSHMEKIIGFGTFWYFCEKISFFLIFEKIQDDAPSSEDYTATFQCIFGYPNDDSIIKMAQNAISGLRKPKK